MESIEIFLREIKKAAQAFREEEGLCRFKKRLKTIVIEY